MPTMMATSTMKVEMPIRWEKNPASAGPITVPSPNAAVRLDSARVRWDGSVRSAT